MTVVVSTSEIAAINEFVKTLGCAACANVTDSASLCQTTYVICGDRPGRYGLNLTARNMVGYIDGATWQRMPNCIRLLLERNSLTGTLPAALVGSSSPLLWIFAQSNRLSGALPAMPASPVLEDFRVTGNQLDGTIPPAYLTLPRIVRLHLSENRFSGDFPRPPSNTSPNLDNFLAGGNQFTGTIGAEWAHLTKDKSLYFQGYSNRLTGTIPDLFSTHKFAYFDFDNNALSGTIPPSLSRQSLVHFNISHNMLSGAFVAPLVRDFCIIDGNQFDSCVEHINATVLCCNVATAQPPTRGNIPTASGALTTTTSGALTMTTAWALLESTVVEISRESQPELTPASVPTSTANDDTALIGGIVGAVVLSLALLLVAACVGACVIKRRRAVSVALKPTTNQYTALPSKSPYADVDVVRKPEHHYDAPTSKLTA